MTWLKLKCWLVAGLWLVLTAPGAQAQESSGFSELPPPCGTVPVSIARMQWPSAAILSHIHAELLGAEYGCVVDVVTGDMTATSSSMATTGQPAVAPEMWVTRIADIWNSAIENQSVRQAGQTFTPVPLEGWFVPDFVVENNPGLGSVETLRDFWQVFRDGGQRARFVSCPPDWACAIINRNLLKAHGLDELFEIVEPANRFELDTLIGEAMSSRDPILFYYWQPNAVMGQFSFTQLDMGAYDAEAVSCLARRSCVSPKPSAFAPEPVVIALADRVFNEVPQVAGYFQRAQMPVGEMNALLAWQSEQAATAEETARHFVETREDIWRPWLSVL